jgi:hypothetical protein
MFVFFCFFFRFLFIIWKNPREMTNLRRDFFFLWIILRYPLETLCGCHSRRPNSSRTFFRGGGGYFFRLSCPDRANDNWSIPVDGSVLTRIIFGFAAIDVDFQLAATEDIDELFYFYYWKKKRGPVGRTDRLQLTVVRAVRRNLALGWVVFGSVLGCRH